MSLEQECRRRPDIEGIGVRLRNGEDWLIPEAEIQPVFEREDGRWIFKRLGVGKPFKGHFDRIQELWAQASGKDSLPDDEYEELAKLGLELPAMALDQNYDLTVDQLGELIDPGDQKMLSGIMSALRGIDRSATEANPDAENVDGGEKKKKLSGSTQP